MSNVVIASHARTPLGSFLGGLSSFTAPELGAHAIQAALSRSNCPVEQVGEVIMGQVLSSGVGQAPARQAALKAGLPESVPCTTVNKVCGSSLKSVLLAAQSIRLGDLQTAVAGGMESMSNAPYLLPKARSGMRLGNAHVLDSILTDGLMDPYGNAHMGTFGDLCANEFAFTREDQDAYAKCSYERALAAQCAGLFSEIAPLKIEQDEEPKNFKPEKMPSLKPAFGAQGSVTAANASKINDGAAALLLMSEDAAQKLGTQPMARIVSTAVFAQDPAHFTTAPAKAIQKALQRANLPLSNIDYFEVNEAFSVVAMATMKELGIPHDRLNIWGGAVALGHPIGASGARILCTLLSILENKKAKRGCAAICLGGGEAIAVIVERC